MFGRGRSPRAVIARPTSSSFAFEQSRTVAGRKTSDESGAKRRGNLPDLRRTRVALRPSEEFQSSRKSPESRPPRRPRASRVSDPRS
ncbi:hypothetical protein NL676_029056 [Syzygium grande]|nr:hypothetical protein NL676_029056 [Syzygium grande]